MVGLEAADRLVVVLVDLDQLDRHRRGEVPGQPCRPFRRGDRIQVVVEPFPTDQARLHGSPFVPEAEPLEQTGRGDVVRVEGGVDAMHPFGEEQVDHGTDSLGGEASPLRMAGQRVAEVGLQPLHRPPHPDLPDDDAVVLDDELVPVAVQGPRRRRQEASHPLAVGRREGKIPVLVAGDRRVVAVGDHCRHVVGPEWPDHETLGVEGREPDHRHARIQAEGGL